MNTSLGLGIALAIAVALLFALWRRLHRNKKSPAELERERRLQINMIGRMTEGTLVEAMRSPDDPQAVTLLLYRYSAAGVEYSAAQDISSLWHLIAPESCWPGVTATVKYDPHHPSNSIIVCEQWNGLPAENYRNARGGTGGCS